MRLTDVELQPYCKTSIVKYGDVSVTELEWDIDGILDTQEAKTKKELADLAPDKVREAVRLIIANANIDCTDGGSYVMCRGVLTDEKELTDQLLSLITVQVEAAVRAVATELTFDTEDAHIFDTSYGENQVRIDCVFMKEKSKLWQALAPTEGRKG